LCRAAEREGRISYCTLDPVMRERQRMSTHMQRVGGSRSQDIIPTHCGSNSRETHKKDSLKAFQSLKAC